MTPERVIELLCSVETAVEAMHDYLARHKTNLDLIREGREARATLSAVIDHLESQESA